MAEQTKPRRTHVHMGAPDQPCAYASRPRSSPKPLFCKLPRDSPIHTRYPCRICNRECWSIDERLRHVDEHH